MTAFEIKVALMEKRVSMRSIARKIGVSPNAVSLVANRRMVSRRIMGELAEAIGAAASDVFPEYFDPAGLSR
jgi:transcriptional regulator with XRE-family HTH domain